MVGFLSELVDFYGGGVVGYQKKLFICVRWICKITVVLVLVYLVRK